MRKYTISESIQESLTHEICCAFCGGTKNDREYMFRADNGTAICDQCIIICAEIIETDPEEEEKEFLN